MYGQTNGNANYDSDISAIERNISTIQTTLNRNAKIPQFRAASFDALDTAVANLGDLYIADVQSTSGAPVNLNRWLVLGLNNISGTYGFQMAIGMDTKIYKRAKTGQSTWGAWTTIS